MDANLVRVETKQLTMAEFISRVNITLGEKLSPEWDIVKRTIFIESLLLQIPIPAFYGWMEASSGEYGLITWQGCYAMMKFMCNSYALSPHGLSYFPELKNKSFDELHPAWRRRLKEYYVTIHLIDAGTPYSVMIGLANRINGWHDGAKW